MHNVECTSAKSHHLRSAYEDYAMTRKNGFVYAITFKNKPKIGRTSNPDKRINAILSQCGISRCDCDIYVVESGDYYKCETKSHALLSSFRVAGEWFCVGHSVAVEAINANVTTLAINNNECFDLYEKIKASFSDASYQSSDQFKSHMMHYGVVPVFCDGKYFTTLPTLEKTDESDELFDYIFKFIHETLLFLIEHDEPATWDLFGIFNSIKDARTLGDIAVMEKIVANAVSDGINAGMDYKDIYKLAKSRCALAVPAIVLK